MAVVGLGGAVATTAVAGLELLRSGAGDTAGLPLPGLEVGGRPAEEVTGMASYADLVVGGWDLDGTDLRKAAELHGVLDSHQLEQAGPHLSSVTPWPAAGDADFCRNVTGGNVALRSEERRVG